MVALVNVLATLLDRLDVLLHGPSRWLAGLDDDLAEVWEPFIDDAW